MKPGDIVVIRDPKVPGATYDYMSDYFGQLGKVIGFAYGGVLLEVPNGKVIKVLHKYIKLKE